MRFIIKTLATVILLISIAFSLTANNLEQFVVLHCDSPGTLTLSTESLISPYLKITGDIDARDIQLLKKVTINVTQVLDLSDAMIHEYYGTEGTKLNLSPNWVWSPPSPKLYPANTLPESSFTEVQDNTLSKYIRGSYSLRKLILPATLTGFMVDALTNNYVLTRLEVPESSTTMRADGPLVYSYDGSTLLAMSPAYYGDLVVAESVVSVSKGVFNGMMPASVTFKSVQIPTFGEENEINAAYIIAEDPDSYKELFPTIDCFTSMETIVIENTVPGRLLSEIGNQGYYRSDIRSLKISGLLNYNDFQQVIELPNLHTADLSEASVQLEGYEICTFSNPSVTHFEFPTFIDISDPNDPAKGCLSLDIKESSRLNGHLEVPEGTIYWNSCYSRRFTSVVFPSTLIDASSYVFSSMSAIESVDFSKCRQLNEIGDLSSGNLTVVKLPEGLKKLNDIAGPIKEINLPNSIEYIRSEGGWQIEKLVLPSSLTNFDIKSLPLVTEIDASKATALTRISGLNHTPNLKNLDLSSCPILYAYELFYANLLTDFLDPLNKAPQRLVAVGGTNHPAPRMAAIEQLVLPSTLQKLNGIICCQRLKKLELGHCFRLKSITGLDACTSLETLSLPESIVSINYIRDCVALNNIYIAASTPPAIPDDFDVSNITLNVGYGLKGIYSMSEGWENCAEINEIGYRVSFDTDKLTEIMDDSSLMLINGAGLYKVGEEAVLIAPDFGAYKTIGWEINGHENVGNPYVVKVDQNIIASPVCTVDQNSCDIVMTIDAPKEQIMKLKIDSYLDYDIYMDGCLYTSFKSKGDSWSNDTYSFNLSPGNHTISLNGKSIILDFEESQDNERLENDYSIISSNMKNYSITSFTVNNMETLHELNPGFFKMDNLNLSNCSLLSSIKTQGKNIISNLDVSYCPELKWIDVHSVELENIKCNDTGLVIFEVYNNKLQSLDLSGILTLTYISAFDNLLTEFNMDAPACECLYLGDNFMAFSTLTPQMYNIYRKMYGEDCNIWFKIYDSKINTTGTIDLSDVMTPANCDTPTVVTINDIEARSEDGNGVFAVPYGWSEIVLSNESYHGLKYILQIVSEYREHAALHDVIADNNFVRVENGNIIVDSPIKIALYSLEGHLIFKGTTGYLTNLNPGVYIAVAEEAHSAGQHVTKKRIVR